MEKNKEIFVLTFFIIGLLMAGGVSAAIINVFVYNDQNGDGQKNGMEQYIGHSDASCYNTFKKFNATLGYKDNNGWSYKANITQCLTGDPYYQVSAANNLQVEINISSENWFQATVPSPPLYSETFPSSNPYTRLFGIKLDEAAPQATIQVTGQTDTTISATLTCTDVLSGCAKTELYYKLSTSQDWSSKVANSGGLVTATGLTPGVQYDLKARAVDAAGNEAFSTPTTATTTQATTTTSGGPTTTAAGGTTTTAAGATTTATPTTTIAGATTTAAPTTTTLATATTAGQIEIGAGSTTTTAITSATAEEAIAAIQDANQTIVASQATKNVTAALELYTKAIDSYNAADYSNAKSLALQSKSSVKDFEQPKATEIPILYIAIGAIVILAALGGVVYFMKMKKGSATETAPQQTQQS